MKKFIRKTLWFVTIIVVILIGGALLPPTPKASQSLLMAQPKKDSLLCKTPKPRIIFVGGSNLSFGIDSEMIKDSLGINPINTAIHAGIGIQFILNDVQRYIQKGDIVILIPEYDRYFLSPNVGSTELLRMVIDVDKSNIQLLSPMQLFSLIKYLPKSAFTRFYYPEYKKCHNNSVYGVDAFNKFGDVDATKHWRDHKIQFQCYEEIDGNKVNKHVIKLIKDFHTALKMKGATLYLSFPCYQDSSFDISHTEIMKVEEAIKESNILTLGTSERYQMADSLMFNTPYHLNVRGMKFRTKLLIEDLSPYLN